MIFPKRAIELQQKRGNVLTMLHIFLAHNSCTVCCSQDTLLYCQKYWLKNSQAKSPYFSLYKNCVTYQWPILLLSPLSLSLFPLIHLFFSPSHPGWGMREQMGVLTTASQEQTTTVYKLVFIKNDVQNIIFPILADDQPQKQFI